MKQHIKMTNHERSKFQTWRFMIMEIAVLYITVTNTTSLLYSQNVFVQ